MAKDKSWKKDRNQYKRPYGNRGHSKKRFLIFCEGEKTEPQYFRSFRVSSAVIKPIGLHTNTLNLVKEAIQKHQEMKGRGEKFDYVCCVFDKDSFPIENFNKAIELAKNEGFKVAYSNEAFELWYLLHFHYFNTAISRADYTKKLDKLLNKKYEKNDENIFFDLLDLQENAISNAIKLLDTNAEYNPGKANPSTTVHELVIELNKYV